MDSYPNSILFCFMLSAIVLIFLFTVLNFGCQCFFFSLFLITKLHLSSFDSSNRFNTQRWAVVLKAHAYNAILPLIARAYC